MAPLPLESSPRCGWQAGSDDVPCGFAAGHTRPHRVRSPYLDGRWIDYVTPPDAFPLEVARDPRWARELYEHDRAAGWRFGRLAYDELAGEVLVRVSGVSACEVVPAGFVYGCELLPGENRIGVPHVRLDAPRVRAAVDAVRRHPSCSLPAGGDRCSRPGDCAAHDGGSSWARPATAASALVVLADRRADQAAADQAAADRVAAALASRLESATSPGDELDLALGASGPGPLTGRPAQLLALDLAQAAASAAGVAPGADISGVRRSVESVLVSRGVARFSGVPAGPAIAARLAGPGGPA